MRADGNHELSDELGKLLSLQSAAAGLRLIQFPYDASSVVKDCG